MRRCRRIGLLDIDQTKAFAVLFLFTHAQQDGKPQPTEGAAALHPVGGIHDFHIVAFVAVFKRRDEVAHLRKLEYALDLFLLGLCDWPEALTHGYLGPHVLNTLFSEMMPSPLQSAFQHVPYRGRRVRLSRAFTWIGEGDFISLHHLFEHERGCHTRQIRSPNSCCQRQPEANEIVDRVSDDRLVQIPDGYLDAALGVSNRAEVSQEAVNAATDGRTLRQGVPSSGTQP